MKDNKLIAEFMGLDSFKDSLASLHQGKINVDVDVYEQAQYHTSWDWLMPVIAKIVKDYGEGWSFEEGYDLSVRYHSVVNFIKECNDEKN